MSDGTDGLRPPALDPAAAPALTGTRYPAPHNLIAKGRVKRILGDPLGLTHFGVNMVRLPPGTWSSQRHWHTHEDELVYVIEGEVVLRTDDGEHVLGAGMCAGFPAGAANGHQLVNRSDRPARYLEISNRDPADGATYSDPDVDLRYSKAADGKGTFTRRDGTPY
jgi:uncharacterized cupin superfamily protein